MSFQKSIMVALVGMVGVAAILGSTTVPKDWTPTGGSRADGTVELSYEIGDLETAQLDDSQGQKLAADRCRIWGYTGAEAFGGVTRKCNAATGYGCYRWLITKQFQCTGFEEYQEKDQKKKATPRP